MISFPKQNIPEKEKTEDWMKDCVDAICAAYNANFWKKTRDILCYEILEGIISEKRFEYITKEFGKNYPVKLKNYPLIKPIISNALGEEIEQNFNYNVKRIDEDGLDYKKRNISHNTIKKILDFILQGQIKTPIDQKYLAQIQDETSNDYITDVEVIAKKLSDYYEYKLDLKTKKNKLFNSTLETGKCFWKIEIPRLGADPKVRPIPSYAIEYANEEIESISDATWVVEKTFMTPEEILDLYGDELTEEQIEQINNYQSFISFDSADFRMSLFESEDAISKLRDEGYEGFYRHYNQDDIRKIQVYKGQWKSIRKMTMAELENKNNPNNPFYKLWNDDKLPSLKKKNVKAYETRYIQELYEFVRIGELGSFSSYKNKSSNSNDRGIYVRTGKSPIQIRSIDNPYYVKSHYNGFIFSTDSNGVPFSLVWYLKDLQELYNILNYHRERIIALSGVKGIIYDMSQIPKGLDITDVLYYKKIGFVPIFNQDNSSYNQFTNYNDSLDASIGVITQMLEDIRMEADRVSGFNRQRQGQMFQKDLVGQIDKAIKQGAYATAVLYHHQDKVYKSLLEDLINFSKYVYYNNGEYKTLSYIIGDGKQEIFKLNEDFVLSDFGIFFSSSGKENAKLESIKQMVQAMASQGQVKMIDALKLLKLDSTAEIETKLIKRLEEQEKMMQELEAQKANQPDKMFELALQDIKTKIEIEKMRLSQLKEIKLLELQLEREKEITKAKTEEEKLEIDRKYKEEIVSLKRELLNVEREEFRDSISKNRNINNRKEIKNII